MPKYLQINIPQACHENWDAMTPNQQGRHCQSCQKTVIDFTSMTDTELVNYFKKHTGKACGRFTNDQLQKDILIPKKPLFSFKYFFQFTIPALLLSLKANAKATLYGERIVQTTPSSSKQIKQDSTTKKTITGLVTDEKGNPLARAVVAVKGTTLGTVTDEFGAFKMSNVNDGAVLLVRHVGYEIAAINTQSKYGFSIQLHSQSRFISGDFDVVVISNTKKKIQKIIPTPDQQDMLIFTKVYPNSIPSSGILNIGWTNAEAGEYTIQIANLQGQVVQLEKLQLDKKQTVSTIQLKNLLAGNYVVTITQTKTGKQFSHRLIVQ